MPDKFGRGTNKERRSAGLLRLSYWMGEKPLEVANPTGLALAVRVARMGGSDDLEICNMLSWTETELTDFMEVHNDEPV